MNHNTDKFKVLITGASGSGTSTLGKMLAQYYNIKWLDLDDFYWEPIEPKYTVKRDLADREYLLSMAVQRYPGWVLSGTLLYWGNFMLPLFDLVVFLTVPTEERISRIISREISIFGEEALFSPKGSRKKLFTDFINWAAKYDYVKSSDSSNKLHDFWSKELHEKWLLNLPCPVLYIDGCSSNQHRLQTILNKLNEINLFTNRCAFSSSNYCNYSGN